MRTYTPKINRHVTYITAGGKLKPATITAVTSPTVVNLRIMHTAQVLNAIAKENAPNQTNVWRVAKAY